MIDTQPHRTRPRPRLVAGTDLDARVRRMRAIRLESYKEIFALVRRRAAELRSEGADWPVEEDVASWLIGAAACELIKSYTTARQLPRSEANFEAARKFERFADGICPREDAGVAE